jgi:Ala-tRNA(Pro) deacylase
VLDSAGAGRIDRRLPVTEHAMPVFDRLVALFTEQGARFRVVEHPAEGRSDVVAAIRGTRVSQGAKAIVCEIDGAASARYALAVVPGDRKLNMKAVARLAGGRKGSFAKPETAEALTGCVIGSIPPLSFNSALPLIVDAGLLAREDEIAFNAGRLDRSIVIDAQDYRRIAAPLVSDIVQ